MARSASQCRAEELALLSLAAGVGAAGGLDALLFVPLVLDVVSALPASSTGSVLTTTPAADSPLGRVVAEVVLAPFPEV